MLFSIHKPCLQKIRKRTHSRRNQNVSRSFFFFVQFGERKKIQIQQQYSFAFFYLRSISVDTQTGDTVCGWSATNAYVYREYIRLESNVRRCSTMYGVAYCKHKLISFALAVEQNMIQKTLKIYWKCWKYICITHTRKLVDNYCFDERLFFTLLLTLKLTLDIGLFGHKNKN